LRLCLDFEGPLGTDLSGGDHDASISSGVSQMTRDTSPVQNAALVQPGAIISVAKTQALELSEQVTFEMWISPESTPDVSFALTNAQYSLEWKDGSVACMIGTHLIADPQRLTLGQWSHVACTFDTLANSLEVYVNGDVRACLGVDSAPPGNIGTAIASNYRGGIDDVHVYARTLSQAEICTLAGRSTCASSCPSGHE
jgi:hypothetical protein